MLEEGKRESSTRDEKFVVSYGVFEEACRENFEQIRKLFRDNSKFVIKGIMLLAGSNRFRV